MPTRATTSARLLPLLALLLLAPPARAQDNVVAEIRSVYPRELRTAGFFLKQDQAVRLDVAGPDARRRRFGLSNAWILDARTREVVWEFDLSDALSSDGSLRQASESIHLPAGAYEVYYASFPYFEGDGGDGDWDDWYDWDSVTLSSLGSYIRDAISGIFDGDRRGWNGRMDWDRAYRDDAHRFGITVRAGRDAYAYADRASLAAAFLDDAFVHLTNLRDDQYVQQGFALARPMEVEVYAVGELRRDEGFDYGWIVNADTRERVWEMDYAGTRHAGGAAKNRVANEVIRLPAGRYAAFFVTDDSHSAEAWNEAPPFDPLVWGLALLPKDPAERRHVSTFDYEHVPRADALVELTRMRDDDYKSRGFTLRAPAELRVYAVGEGRGGDMFDYGWIVDADTRERVWEMDYYDTEHAGGGDKNRMVDEVIRLDAGNYVAYFVTDDSHAYADWNTGAPFDREAWGLTILPARPGARVDALPYEESADPAVLVRLTGLRDDVHRRERFALDRDADVRVYALGEGDDGDMYDYGWIEDARTGRVVWEMGYRMTEHAGGARKNRVVNAVVPLKAGEYVVHYETDGSHDFGGWNDSPPADPASWGITLRKANR